MSTLDRDSMLQLIERNIRASGYHVYVVAAGTLPRWAYTIGLSERFGAELVLAGSSHYGVEEVRDILDGVRERVEVTRSFDMGIELDALGTFKLREVRPSWVRSLLLGAVDYYGGSVVSAYQIVPDQAHSTIDVPNLAREWSVETEPVWQWLQAPWPYAVPASSTAATNLEALRGARITEATRWEEGYWELFAGAGPDVRKEDMRIVLLSSLLAIDPSLAPVVELEIGTGLWRDSEAGSWHSWRSSAS